MATKNLVPRSSGEGGIGVSSKVWGEAFFDTGHFNKGLYVSGVAVSTGNAGGGLGGKWEDGTTLGDIYYDGGNVGIGTTIPSAKLDVVGGINFSGNIIPETNDTFDIGAADKKIRDLYLGSNSLHIGESSIQSVGDNVYFSKPPKVADAEGNPASLLSADAVGLGTSEVLESDPGDLKFKLLTDQNRFVIGTTGSNDLASGWYRFNDFEVKGATDIGSHIVNPVDTRIYSDETSFILFSKDSFGNKSVHLVSEGEEVAVSNAISLGISARVDSSDSPQDVEFTHTDGESYSLINGDSDTKGFNNIPVRQVFQPPSIGANPSPLLIDGGSF